jgi:hypothetical protein
MTFDEWIRVATLGALWAPFFGESSNGRVTSVRHCARIGGLSDGLGGGIVPHAGEQFGNRRQRLCCRRTHIDPRSALRAWTQTVGEELWVISRFGFLQVVFVIDVAMDGIYTEIAELAAGWSRA